MTAFMSIVLKYLLLPVLALMGSLMLALKCSYKFREALFARYFFPLSMYFLGDKLDNICRVALAPLDDVVSHDPSLRKENAVRMLEVGAGYGASMEYIKRKVKYWNVDPNVEFQARFSRMLKRHPNIEMERYIASGGEDMADVPSDHFDVVLLKYVLCVFFFSVFLILFNLFF